MPAWLFEPAHKSTHLGEILEPAVEGRFGEGELFPLTLKRCGPRGLKTWVDAEWEAGEDFPLEPEGCWICVEKSTLLKNSGDIYYFQLVGCQVKEESEAPSVGRVERIRETGAHAILEIRLETGEEILIPLVDEYVEIRLEESLLLIPRLREFQI